MARIEVTFLIAAIFTNDGCDLRSSASPSTSSVVACMKSCVNDLAVFVVNGG